MLIPTPTKKFTDFARFYFRQNAFGLNSNPLHISRQINNTGLTGLAKFIITPYYNSRRADFVKNTIIPGYFSPITTIYLEGRQDLSNTF